MSKPWEVSDEQILVATRTAESMGPGWSVTIPPDRSCVQITPPKIDDTVSAPKPKSVIYFIQATESGKIKIGFSTKLSARFSRILTECPEPVELLGTIVGTIEEEQALHKKFAHIRHVGEWFRGEPELLAYIEALPK